MKPWEMNLFKRSSKSSSESPESSELDDFVPAFSTFLHFGTGGGVSWTCFAPDGIIFLLGVAAEDPGTAAGAST